MDESSGIKRSKDVVHLVADVPEQRGHGKGEHHVPEPVGRGGEGDGLGADLGREDLGGIGPRDGTPCCGKGGDEEVGAGYDGGRGRAVVDDDPGDVAVIRGARDVGVGLTKMLLNSTWGDVLVAGKKGGGQNRERTGDEKPGHHAKGAENQRRATAPFVEKDDGREGEGNVDDILNRGGSKGRGNLGRTDAVRFHAWNMKKGGAYLMIYTAK